MTQTNAAEARTFLTNFHPEPEAVAKMPDDAVLKWHSRVNEFHGKAVNDAVAKAREGLVPQDWPEDWRKKIAGDDDSKQLERFASPKDIWGKARELEKKLSGGEYKFAKPYPEKGTAEEQLAWRREAGIPEAPEKYELKDKNGLPLKDEIKAANLQLLKFAHSRNLPPAVVNDIVNYGIESEAQAVKADAEQDAVEAQECEDALRKEWGNERFRGNQNRIDNFLSKAPKALQEVLAKTRLANGKLLKNDPLAQQWLLNIALEGDPATTLVPGASGNVATSIDDEINKIKGWMNAPKGSPDNKKYWGDENVQKRYRELLAAQEHYKQKAA